MALSGISVVLCCAREDEPHLSVVVEHLRRESIEPVVLGGVEEDSHRLGTAVDNERGRALFVLCKSNVLGPSEVLRLEGIFGARKGPSHRMIATRLRPEDALSMLKEIRAALSGFTSSRSSFEDSDDDGGSMREVVNMSGISAVGSDARGPAPMRERLASRQTPADPLAVPMRGRAGEHAARVPAHQSGAWQHGADIGDTVSEKKAPLAAEAGAGEPPPRSLLPEPAPPRSGVLMPALVGGLLVAVLGVGALVLARDTPGTDAARTTVPTAPAPAPQAVAAPVKPAPTPAPAPAPTPADPAADDGSEAAGEATGVDDEAGDREPDEPDGAVDAETAISEAIANGEMRALDLLLVIAPEKERPWRKAVDHCRLKRVNGVKGWRLPTLPELKKLRGARMLKPGRYWSSTRAAGAGDEVYVLDRNTRKVELIDKEAEDVVVMCVRPR